MPVALKKAKPGTKEFRAAMRDAIETMGRTIFSHGVMNWTHDDHWGFTNETGVMLKVVNGDFKVEKCPAAALDRAALRRGVRCASLERPARPWTLSIAGILLLDGVTNGAIYALLGLATVLVFAVTRVIFIPQGEFVAYGALTLAILQTGKVPGTVWLLLILAGVAALMDAVDEWRRAPPRRGAALRAAAAHARLSGGGGAGHGARAAPRQPHLAVQALLSVARGHGLRPAGLPPRLPVAGRRQRAGAADRLGRRALRADRPGPAVLRRRGLAHPGASGTCA